MSLWSDIHNRLEELAELPPNWDSYNGLPLQPTARLHAEALLYLVAREEPSVSLTSDGGVQLEWENDQLFMAITIEPHGVVHDGFSIEWKLG